MKLRVIFAAAVLLAVSSGLRADVSASSSQNSWQWVSQYYANPRPDDLLRVVHNLSRTDYFEAVGQPAIAIGFFSTVFAQNPQRIDLWLSQTKDLPERHQRILAAAAWKAGSARGARLMSEMSANDNAELRAEIRDLLASGSRPVAETPVLTASSMNLQWGAFLATGDERYVLNVLAALGSNERGLATSARFALAQNAAAHPRVLEICQAQLSKQPASVREELRAAINAASTGRQPGA